MVQRRAKAAGIKTKIGCHTFRATGITIYLTNGGDPKKAQQMAAHWGGIGNAPSYAGRRFPLSDSNCYRALRSTSI
jgi:integrase